jgi:HK97 family phage prohead protease
VKKKFYDGAVVQDALGERQIRVVASDPTPDRAGDVVVPAGCVLVNYRKNPIVLADHDQTKPIGNAEAVVRNGRLEALITFAPAGASEKADEYCALAKAGVLNTISIGFTPIEASPIKGGGVLFSKWELLEMSVISVPANPNALVIGRSFNKAGRVLSGSNAAKLKAAHDAAEQCRLLVKDVLDGADCDDEDEEKAAQQQRRRKLYALQMDSNPAKSKRLRQIAVLELQMIGR